MFSKSYFDKKCNFHFCRFLQYCIENKSNIGCNFEEEEDELEDSIQKLDQVKITASLGKKIYPNMEFQIPSKTSSGSCLNLVLQAQMTTT